MDDAPPPAMEDQRRRLQGAGLLRRLSGRLRRGAGADLDPAGTLVHHPLRPYMVQEPRRGVDRAGCVRGDEAEISQADGGPKGNTHEVSRGRETVSRPNVSAAQRFQPAMRRSNALSKSLSCKLRIPCQVQRPVPKSVSMLCP